MAVLWRVVSLVALCALASCGGTHRLTSSGSYAAPGPAGDPWGPYIREASSRFNVPEPWIRAVMRQESGGHEYLRGRLVTSDAGAMGLMQIMPATYQELRARYGLGDDPYEPHDNIVAGTGYLHELYDQYGAPAFLAAYNAGPRRLEDYLAGRGALPNQTQDYVAALAPALGRERPMTGPLAGYATGGVAYAALQSAPRGIGGCDLDAAYNPDRPCRPARSAAPARVATFTPPRVELAAAEPSGARACDPDAAYDPDRPCQPVRSAPPVEVAAAPPLPPPVPTWHPVASALAMPSRFALISSAQAEPRPAWSQGGWAIQVGAFANPAEARHTAETMRGIDPASLAQATTVIGATAQFGGRPLYRARLLGLTQIAADNACARLTARRFACLTVPPGG